MRSRIWNYLLPVILAGSCSLAHAQRTDLRLLAVLGSWERNDDSSRFAVTASDTANATHVISGTCSARGKCRLNLPLDHVYRVELTGTGHVTKHVILDLNGPTIKQRKWGYRMRFAVKLMPRIDSVDYSICERPLGFSHFEKKENQFTWDERYTHELTPYYETMQNAYEERKRKLATSGL
jgi:hypothetical protein